MNEIEINRASHLIDPNLQIWGFEIPIYLFLGGLTAGIMILSPLIGHNLPEERRSKWIRYMPFAAPVLISVGMVALFLDLEFKLHVLRFFAAFRPSSPMSWGSWILIGIYPATVLLGLAALNQDETNRLLKASLIAPFKSVVQWARDFALRHRRGLIITNIALGIGLGGYTGLLLGTLGARHIWNSAVLGPLFLVSGVSTGAAFMMLFPLAHEEHRLLRNIDLGAIGLELFLLAVFLIGLISGGADARAAATALMGGDYTAVFWALVVVAGLLVPLLIEMIEMKKRLSPTLFAPAFILAGGLALRWILVLAGQA
jgi:formate-dependent nitrite reductase membrane component NrfD